MTKKKTFIHSFIKIGRRKYFCQTKFSQAFLFLSPSAKSYYSYRTEKKNILHDFFGFNFIRINKTLMTCLPKEKIAVLMLSSAQGETTLVYLKELLQNKIKHIAVIGKMSPKMQKQILELQAQTQAKIYLLGHLNAKNLKKILSAAHLLIVKGGGLSLMELASLSLRPDCDIFIHHPAANLDLEHHQGLVWEDGNILWFLDYCQKNQKKARLCNPENICNYLSAL